TGLLIAEKKSMLCDTELLLTRGHNQDHIRTVFLELSCSKNHSDLERFLRLQIKVWNWLREECDLDQTTLKKTDLHNPNIVLFAPLSTGLLLVALFREAFRQTLVSDSEKTFSIGTVALDTVHANAVPKQCIWLPPHTDQTTKVIIIDDSIGSGNTLSSSKNALLKHYPEVKLC
ncbi:MAG: hypothetical protein RIQ56_352, partial [Candidatus Parcubacteria bacterium]